MEREQFLEHYMDIERSLRGYLLAATGDLHEANDLSQVVWQVLWKKLDQFDEARSFKAWSFGIARFEVLKWRQGKARSREILCEETIAELADTAIDHSAYLSERRFFLMECVAELTKKSRRVLDLKYKEGHRSKEIGGMINRSAEAVDMMLSRTRKILRDCVKRKTMKAQ